MKVLKTIAFFAGAIIASSASAHAANCMFGMTLYDGNTGAHATTTTNCADYTGNDKGTPGLNDETPFGFSDWNLAWSSDDGQEAGQPDFGVTGDFSGTSGDWSVTSFLGYTELLFVLKASTEYTAFVLDSAFTSGDWTTADLITNNKGNAKDLSHASIWVRGTPADPVPVPGAIGLFAAGIAGLYGARRAKKA